MSTKIYDERVTVSPELDKLLKKTLVNHLLVYNHCLWILYNDPETKFHTLKKHATVFIETNSIHPIVNSALYNEIYYQFKKFKKNVKVRKHITDIQYFTFTISSYTNNSFLTNETRDKIRFNEFQEDVLLTKPLPELGTSGELLYVNMSYSNIEDGYRINLYQSK